MLIGLLCGFCIAQLGLMGALGDKTLGPVAAECSGSLEDVVVQQTSRRGVERLLFWLLEALQHPPLAPDPCR